MHEDARDVRVHINKGRCGLLTAATSLSTKKGASFSQQLRRLCHCEERNGRIAREQQPRRCQQRKEGASCSQQPRRLCHCEERKGRIAHEQQPRRCQQRKEGASSSQQPRKLCLNPVKTARKCVRPRHPVVGAEHTATDRHEPLRKKKRSVEQCERERVQESAVDASV